MTGTVPSDRSRAGYSRRQNSGIKEKQMTVFSSQKQKGRTRGQKHQKSALRAPQCGRLKGDPLARPQLMVHA